jgi:carbonic anhydrase/acetyltransferase-like protein (isoleucine patch superfamily)
MAHLASPLLWRLGATSPNVAAAAFVAGGAQLIGSVTLHSGSSVWFNAVLRGDDEPITIGKHSNVQDNSTIHVDSSYPCTVGEFVTIGHGAVLHGCTIENNVLIGMHATVLNGAVIGQDSIVGAHTLITENARIPSGSLVVGIPGRVVRQLRPEEINRIRSDALHYVSRAIAYRDVGPAVPKQA